MPNPPSASVFNPYNFELFAGLEVPDPITFILGQQWLAQRTVYPRQATLIKIIFLRDDLFTDYDHAVIDEWESNFRSTGNNGITPGVRERITILKQQGYGWFREVLLVMGRRAGKGHVSAQAMSYILWNYMATGNPQDHYGIAPNKQLECLIYAGKKEQARRNLFKDLSDAIINGPCFTPYISRSQAESLTVFAPYDKVKMAERARRGTDISADQASFRIEPKEATLMSGRGGASFMQGYDEMSHVVASGANRSAEEIYCLDPSTKILGSDLTWRPISSLRVGDELVAFDEYPKSPGEQRKLRAATVEGIRWSRSAPIKITFADGTSVVSSKNHRWFRVSPDGNNGKWILAGQVSRPGSAGNPAHLAVGDFIRHIVDPWEVDETREGGYVSGIFDGEGWMTSGLRSSYSAYRVGFSQNEGPVLEEVKRILKDAGFDLHTIETLPCKQVEVHGIADGLRLLGTYQPLRLMGRSKEFWEGRTPRGYVKSKQIVSIEELPEQDLIDIQTSESTFLAEGFVSHNSAATPALDQFKKDAFIIEPSSPWQMTGQFYANYQNALSMHENGKPEYPNMLMLQLTSWDIYKDWEIAHTLPAFPANFEGDLGEYINTTPPNFPKLKVAFQEYDEEMQKLEKSNPDTFKVERMAHWATTMDAYLDPEHIEKMWDENLDNRIKRGPLDFYYKAHGDPSNSNANFGLAVAHLETDPNGSPWQICVFDYIHHWSPADYPDHTIDYEQVIDEIWEIIKAFPIDEFTVDQFNSGPITSLLKGKLHREMHFPTYKRPNIFEVTATGPLNWKKAENFKTALNQGWIKAPFYEQADLELKFLRLTQTATTMRVDKQDTGPVVTKDVADAMFECVYALLGDQIMAYMQGLSATPSATLQGGITPFQNVSNFEEQLFSQLGGGGAGRYRGENGFGGSASPTRGLRRPGYRPQNGR